MKRHALGILETSRAEFKSGMEEGNNSQKVPAATPANDAIGEISQTKNSDRCTYGVSAELTIEEFGRPFVC
ncbi:MAG: hypothetical protein WC835_03600 [Candidatus Paceibacterota bacterium]